MKKSDENRKALNLRTIIEHGKKYQYTKKKKNVKEASEELIIIMIKLK